MLKNIRRIEIELHSYCNRKCSWCTNSKFPRSEYKEMPEDTYLNLIKQLKDNHFGTLRYFEWEESRELHVRPKRPTISFNGYCEPLYNADLLKTRVNQARNVLSDEIIYVTNTNADFISIDALNNLPLNRLHIMDYNCRGKKYWKNKFKELGVLYMSSDENMLTGTHKNIGKVIVHLDWPVNSELENRGGIITEELYYKDYKMKYRNGMEERIKTCVDPTYYISIRYDGSVMLCCHVSEINPEHEDYILGNINEELLTDILNNEKTTMFRNKLSSDNYSEYPSCCKNCQKDRLGIYAGFIKELK